MRQFHVDLYFFFDLLDRIFFLNGFFNSLIAHSRPSFLFELNFHMIFDFQNLLLAFCFLSGCLQRLLSNATYGEAFRDVINRRPHLLSGLL